jgi:hypothetical protein
MSYFLPEKGVLFLHIPRTGGTWIGASMNTAEIPIHNWGRVCEMYRPRKHTILPHYRPDLIPKIKWIFSFVRHPVDYYVSVWRFTTRSVDIRPEKMRRDAFDKGDSAAINEGVNRWKPDFYEWIEEMLEEEPGWVTRMFERYVGPERGEFPHYIGRTETLEQDAREVMRIVGYEEEWEKAQPKIRKIVHAKNRVRNEKAPQIEVGPELRDRIERSERVALRRFFGKDTFCDRVYRDLQGVPVQNG